MKRFRTHKVIALVGGLLLATTVQATPMQWVPQLLPSLTLLGPIIIDPGQGDKHRKGRDTQNVQEEIVPCPVVIDPGLGNKHRKGK